MKIDQSLMKQIVFAGIVTAAITVFAAQRKVSIVAAGSSSSSGGTSPVIQLQNGSTTAVSYAITCYSNGTIVSGMNNAAQTLPGKMSKTYGAYICANGATGDTYNLNGGVHRCGSSDYAGRVSACSSGYTTCTFAEANAALGGATGGSGGWVEVTGQYANQASGAFEVSDWSGTFTGGVNYSGQIASMSPGSYKCRPSGGGTAINNCYPSYATNTMSTFCCPSGAAVNGKIDNCDVMINSSETGFLQSPQFKGNSPF